MELYAVLIVLFFVVWVLREQSVDRLRNRITELETVCEDLGKRNVANVLQIKALMDAGFTDEREVK
jgi:hypothetical protein